MASEEQKFMRSLAHLAVVCFKNRKKVEASQKVGCYYCEKIYDATEVIKYTTEIRAATKEQIEQDEKAHQTALCPHCGIDAVLADFEIEVTSELLKEMNIRSFQTTMTGDELIAWGLGIDSPRK